MNNPSLSFDLPNKESAPEQGAAVSYNPRTDAKSESPVEQAKRKHQNNVMTLPGVKGMAITKDRIGNSAIVVYLVDQSYAKNIPKQLEGIPVITEVTGEIDAQ